MFLPKKGQLPIRVVGKGLVGGGFKDWLKKKFSRSKKALLQAGKQFANDKLKPMAVELLKKNKETLMNGATDIIKNSVGNMASAVMKNPGAAKEILQEGFKEATGKGKSLIKQAVNENKQFVMDNKEKVISDSKVALSDMLGKIKIGADDAVDQDYVIDGAGMSRYRKPKHVKTRKQPKPKETRVVKGAGAYLLGSQRGGELQFA